MKIDILAPFNSFNESWKHIRALMYRVVHPKYCTVHALSSIKIDEIDL